MPSLQRLFLAFLALIILSCSPAATRVPPSVAPTPSPPNPTSTWTPLPYAQCGWQWAQRDMPDVTATFQQALSNADLPFDPERTRAYAFGENCLDPGGNVQHFAAMETDFVVTQAPHDPGDRVELGNYAGAVLRLILSDFGPGSVPGPQEGNVDFVFVTGGEEIRGRVLLADAGSVLASGLEGAELYTALFP